MEKKEFFHNYKDLTVEFQEAYKNRFEYIGAADGLNVSISSVAEYRDTMSRSQKVCEFDEEETSVMFDGEYLE